MVLENWPSTKRISPQTISPKCSSKMIEHPKRSASSLIFWAASKTTTLQSLSFFVAVGLPSSTFGTPKSLLGHVRRFAQHPEIPSVALECLEKWKPVDAKKSTQTKRKQKALPESSRTISRDKKKITAMQRPFGEPLFSFVGVSGPHD